jgi:hypothetical protein
MLSAAKRLRPNYRTLNSGAFQPEIAAECDACDGTQNPDLHSAHDATGSFASTPVVSGLSPYDVIAGGLPGTGSFPTKFSHSVAADSVFNRIFVPVSNTGARIQ